MSGNVTVHGYRFTVHSWQKLAKGLAAELRTQVYISREVGIFSDIDAKELIQELKATSKMLQALYNSLNTNRKL